jgi:hypothetical protein
VNQEENEGSLLCRESQMIRLREALEACHLGDLGFSGSQFTWSNRRSDGSFTRERLDRAVADPEWCNIFPRVSVLVLAARTSDHSPLIVSSHARIIGRVPYKRSFKFEVWWEKDAECAEVINSAWNEDSTERGTIAGIQNNLSQCESALRAWSRRKFGNVEKLNKKKRLSWRLSKKENPRMRHPRLSHYKGRLMNCLNERRYAGNKEPNSIGLAKGTEIQLSSTLGHNIGGKSIAFERSLMSRVKCGGKRGILVGLFWVTTIGSLPPKLQVKWRIGSGMWSLESRMTRIVGYFINFLRRK